MALDERLLTEAAMLGGPLLRFYGWTVPAATFGLSQRYAEVAGMTALRPLIRRPTGGGLVPHNGDWTYTVVIPPDHEWYRLRAEASYRRLHDWLRRAFFRVGVMTGLVAEPDRTGPGQCFVGAELHDLLCRGTKLAGAAQRRTRTGLLIQGSVQPPPTGVARADWEQAMTAEVGREPDPGTGVGWERWTPGTAFLVQVDRLAGEKYAQTAHNQRR